jgi:hypothetical protein
LMAAAELVVPKSIPIAFDMIFPTYHGSRGGQSLD